MALSSLTAVRSAEFSGKISWKTIHTISLQSKNTKFVFYIQKPRFFAVIEKSIYKPWRIVMRKKIRCRWVGHVLGEFDRKSDALNALRSIEELFSTGFEKLIKQSAELKHGDVISVPTSMPPGARHFGIYDAKKVRVIEYQPANGSKIIMSIQATSYIEFRERVVKKYGSFDLRKHNYLKSKVYEGNKVVQRAISKLGVYNFNPIWRNCESFAVWCKTGNSQTIQAREKVTKVIDCALKLGALTAVIIVVAGAVYVLTPGAAVAITTTKTSGGFLGFGATTTTSTTVVPTAATTATSTVTSGGFLGFGATTTTTAATAIPAATSNVVSGGTLAFSSGSNIASGLISVTAEGFNKKICDPQFDNNIEPSFSDSFEHKEPLIIDNDILDKKRQQQREQTQTKLDATERLAYITYQKEKGFPPKNASRLLYWSKKHKPPFIGLTYRTAKQIISNPPKVNSF